MIKNKQHYSSGDAVIEMQEFSDTDDNHYEVPIPSSPTVMSSLNPNAPVSFVPAPTNNGTMHLHSVSAVVLPSSSLEEQQGVVGGNEQTLPKTVEGELDSYPVMPSKVWLPSVMNIVPRSISIPLKEKYPSKFKEGGWVLHQGMQTEKVIKTVIHTHVQSATKKKQVRHIHVKTDISATRRFTHAYNQKCLVEHTEHFNATHSCKKQMVKNVVNTGLEVVNKVQENFSPSNI